MASTKSRATRGPTVKTNPLAATTYVKQVCSRCEGTGTDPEMSDCRCDVCDGTGEEEVPAGYVV